MPTLRWDRMTWEEFITGLEAYRDNFSGRSDENFAYLRCLNQLRNWPMAERAARAPHIVTFLNAWHCRLKPTETRMMLSIWIREHAQQLEALSAVGLLDDELPDVVDEMQALYDDLMAVGRAAVPNWSDAAASKTLHQLVPGLLVMWDVNIKPFAEDYRDFIREMHRLGRRLVEQVETDSAEVETHLQQRLGYRVRKTMAKYLDEFNWYVMGRTLERTDPRARVRELLAACARWTAMPGRRRPLRIATVTPGPGPSPSRIVHSDSADGPVRTTSCASERNRAVAGRGGRTIEPDLPSDPVRDYWPVTTVMAIVCLWSRSPSSANARS